MSKYHGRPIPAPYEQYHHFKGKDYQVIALATKEDDGQQLVIYQQLYDDHKIWARSLESFLGKVDRTKYPDAVQKYRFARIGEEIETVEPITQARAESAPQEPASAVAATQHAAKDTTEEQCKAQGNSLDGQSDCLDDQSEYTDQQGGSLDNPEDGDLEGMDPRILDFLDATSNRDRLDILARLHHDITDEMIDTLAVVSGLEIAPGPIEDRYHDLRDCLLTISRYELEGNRLR